MNSLTDHQLLREYSERRSEAVFAELVKRHVDFAYSAALRMVRDTHLAKDVTQDVFVALAQNAGQLMDRPVLLGWLHRAAQNIAANAIRSEVRRRTREEEAVAMNELLSAESDAVWEQVAPHLDAALGELAEGDREVLLLRYFAKKSLHEVGITVGTSEDAAQKRVSRAIERLRDYFAKRGVTVGASGLAIAISANAVQAAPVSLAAAITTAAALGVTTIATFETATVIKTIAMTTLQKTLVALTLTVTIGTGIYEANQASHLQTQLQRLQEQQSPLDARIQKLQVERDDATRQLTSLRADTEHLNQNAELLKLRGEVALLRADARELAQLKNEKGSASDPSKAAMQSWLARVKEYKRLPERMPDKAIPELRLLTEEDWLELTKEPLGHHAEEINLNDESVARLALDAMRSKVKDKLMRVFSRALEGYANSNDGLLPPDILQLKPHLMNKNFLGPARAIDIVDSAVDDSVLGRYEILQTGKLANVPNDLTILAEKAPVDSKYDSCLKVGRSWMGVSTSSDAYSPEKRERMD